MTRVSKKALSPKQIDKLFLHMNSSLTKLSTKDADRFLSELLGTEERLMLAKRLTVIVMLVEGYSLYKVARTLNVSTATADKIRKRIEKGEYAHTLSILKKDKAGYKKILTIIDSALTLGGFLPKYIGNDRYRSFKKPFN